MAYTAQWLPLGASERPSAIGRLTRVLDWLLCLGLQSFALLTWPVVGVLWLLMFIPLGVIAYFAIFGYCWLMYGVWLLFFANGPNHWHSALTAIGEGGLHLVLYALVFVAGTLVQVAVKLYLDWVRNQGFMSSKDARFK